MKMVKLSDFYPYDRNKGGIQELHHKIESKTLQYWGEDSGILIGITPIYKRRLWSEEVKVVNDKMTNMKTRTYEGVQHGDWVRCVLCGAQMLLPCGADKCPECGENGTLRWVDEERQEIDAKGLDCLDYVRELDEKIRDMLNKASADIMKWCDKNMIKYNKELKESRSTKKHCEGLRKHIANLERRLLKHALANVILSIISVAAIIALFTLIQN